jgi:anti-sigma factor RsiW
MTDEFRDWDAAYVLGALSPDDRRAYERHLESCPECRAQVAELAGVPGILAAVSPEEAVALVEGDEAHEPESAASGPEAPPTLVQSLASSVGRRRRRARRRLTGVLIGSGAVLAAAGLVVGLVLAPSLGPAPTGTTYAMAAAVPGSVEAEIAVTGKAWGTRFDWNCSYGEWADSGVSADYDLVVTDLDGQDTVVATWTAVGAKAGSLSASTSIPLDRIRSVEIRLPGSDQALAQADIAS